MMMMIGVRGSDDISSSASSFGKYAVESVVLYVGLMSM